MTNDFKNRMENIQLKVSFEYSYLQAALTQKVHKATNLAYRSDLLARFRPLKDLNRTLEIAFANKSLNGCLECYIKLLYRALNLGIILKYRKGGDGMST